MDEQPEQLDMPTGETPMFATDEDLDRRIRRCENAVADFEARLPALRRELDVLLDLAHPERHRAPQPSG